MKKAIFIVSIILFSNLCYAIELWNGFTTEMSEEQLLARANEVLNPRAGPSVSSPGLYILPSREFKGAYRIPEKADKTISFISDAEGMYIIKEGQGAPYFNAFFHFCNNKLFAVRVIWAATADDLLNITTQRYGRPTILKYIFVFSKPDEEIRMWKLDGRDLFIGRDNYNSRIDNRSFVFIDQQTQREYQAEYENAEKRRRIEEETKRQSVNDSVTF